MQESTISAIQKIILTIIYILIVIFFVNGGVGLFKAIFKTIAFEEYPLQSYMYEQPEGKNAIISAKDLVASRKLQMLEDYAGAISMILIAGGLFWLTKKQEKFLKF